MVWGAHHSLMPLITTIHAIEPVYIRHVVWKHPVGSLCYLAHLDWLARPWQLLLLLPLPLPGAPCCRGVAVQPVLVLPSSRPLPSA